MKPADVRRAVLRALIEKKFNGVARQLALAAKKPEGQINDMLSSPPRKSFGEKIARQLETNLKLGPLYFDRIENSDLPLGQAREDGRHLHAVKPPPNLTNDETTLLDGFRVADKKDRETMLFLSQRALMVFQKRSEQQ